MNKILVAGLATVGALLLAAPAWADRGHRHGHGHGHGHWKHHHQGHHPHVRHHFHHRHHTVVRERWYPAPVYAAPVYPAPVYAAPAPAAGIHLVLPNFFIPLR